MNWLIISKNEDEKDELNGFINEAFPGSVVYNFFSHESLDPVYEILNEVNDCIIIDDKSNSSLDFITGYLCAKEYSVFTTVKDLSKVELDVFENIHTFKDTASVLKYISDNKDDILEKEGKLSSRNYLLENGLAVNGQSFKEAVNRGDKNLCACFLEAGLDINTLDDDGTPLINIACRNDNLELVQWFVDNGSDLEAVSKDRGYTPLMDAVWKGSTDIVEYLIKNHADVNKLSKDGQNMIVLAVGGDKIDICRLLVDGGANVDVPDAMGMSGYGYAKLFKKEEILRILEKNHKED